MILTHVRLRLINWFAREGAVGLWFPLITPERNGFGKK